LCRNAEASKKNYDILSCSFTNYIVSPSHSQNTYFLPNETKNGEEIWVQFHSSLSPVHFYFPGEMKVLNYKHQNRTNLYHRCFPVKLRRTIGIRIQNAPQHKLRVINSNYLETILPQRRPSSLSTASEMDRFHVFVLRRVWRWYNDW
jgi:hypothetical protein